MIYFFWQYRQRSQDSLVLLAATESYLFVYQRLYWLSGLKVHQSQLYTRLKCQQTDMTCCVLKDLQWVSWYSSRKLLLQFINVFHPNSCLNWGCSLPLSVFAHLLWQLCWEMWHWRRKDTRVSLTCRYLAVLLCSFLHLAEFYNQCFNSVIFNGDYSLECQNARSVCLPDASSY